MQIEKENYKIRDEIDVRKDNFSFFSQYISG